MFDSLTNKLTDLFSKLRGKGRLTEQDVTAGLREIRMALLEADVHYKVAKELTERIKERAIGEEVLGSLTPGQQVIKIVRDELTATMGGERAPLDLSRSPSVILLVGLQGSGKTTSAAKLAIRLKKEGRKPMLIAADIYRPAAVDQLETLGKDADVPVFSLAGRQPADIVAQGLDWAQTHLRDVVIVDTAGRLQIDEDMMAEVDEIARVAKPSEILLVADAMTGQEAVNIASAFHDRLGLTGAILTKLDGDARGGAALSIRHLSGCPIKFVGTGEKLSGLEPFHPQRMAERILGMGDVLTLIEQAEQTLDQGKAEDLAQKLRKNQFSLQDFLEQLEEMQKLGPLSSILEKLPGAAKLKNAAVSEEESETKRTVAILRSMTLEERLNASIIGGSRKKRIARGSGTQVRDVNRVLARFAEAKRALKMLGGRRGKGKNPLDAMGLSS
ncbi:signal recognition particle protein [Candidatus Bipolaricaulota bacterium]|nr:signal recognition particle protein [Candidatus Bipolaricaulota bacterium]TFH09473.1 MAG: signal recognition particle protein [Candidatus Atribacteria bacterium]